MQEHNESKPHGSHGNAYSLFLINMLAGLAIMYAAMFTMIDSWTDYRNNLNMFYMALTMWAPMGLLMLVTMPSMFRNRTANLSLATLFVLLTLGSFMATRSQALIGDRQFIASMIPHHSGAILMCNKTELRDAELLALCRSIASDQRAEIDKMKSISDRLEK